MTHAQQAAQQRALETIRSYSGQTFLYHTKEVKIVNVTADGDEVTVATSHRVHVLTMAELPAYVEELLPIGDEDEEAESRALAPTSKASQQVETAQVQIITPMSGTFDVLTTALLDSLKKVQENPSYIPQAKAVQSLAQATVNVAKTQLEAIRLAKGNKR